MLELAPRHKSGLALAGPVMNAAGVLGFAGEYRALADLRRLGAFVTNPLTCRARTPARPPNAVLAPGGMVIHTGLPNPGVRGAIRRHNREWRRLGVPVIIHLAATTPDEVARSLEALERADGVSGIELGLRDDSPASEVAQVVRAAAMGPPLLVRLPLGRAAEVAPVAAQAGADALTVAAPPRLTAAAAGHPVTGRFYGPGTFPEALRAVHAVAALGLGLPLVGAGGIYSPGEARAMLEAGAVAIQVEAAAWNRPAILAEIAEALSG